MMVFYLIRIYKVRGLCKARCPARYMMPNLSARVGNEKSWRDGFQLCGKPSEFAPYLLDTRTDIINEYMVLLYTYLIFLPCLKAT